MMKKIIITIFAVFVCSTVLNQKIFAIVHVGASIVASGSYDLDDSEGFKNQKMSGTGFNVVIPFGMMIRVDQISAKSDFGDRSFTSDTTIYSLGYRFGFPLTPLHFSGAFGVGSAKSSLGGGNDFKDVNQTQLYLEAGYNIIPLFDLYLGYHQINGSKLEPKSGNESFDSKLAGTAYSLGINFGF